MFIDDQARLRHILEAAREAQEFTAGKTRADLDSDRMRVLALVKDIEIVDEAADRLSSEVKAKYPHVPWKDIFGMRSNLIDAYFRIDLNVLWDTIEVNIPPLLRDIRDIISRESQP